MWWLSKESIVVIRPGINTWKETLDWMIAYTIFEDHCCAMTEGKESSQHYKEVNIHDNIFWQETG